MSHSQRLSSAMLRSVFRLIHEVCELGHDPEAWRRHMLSQLGGMIGAKSGRSAMICGPIIATKLELLVSADWGSDTEELTAWRKYLAAGDISTNPLTPAVLSRQSRSMVRTREQLCDDRAWYASSYFNDFRRPIRSDHLLYCHIVLRGMGAASATGFTRALGDKPFGRREVLMAAVLQFELRRLWKPLLCGSTVNVLATLTSRQRQVIALLAAGDAEKQIAMRLGLSRHTVHNYLRAMYRKLEVNSRAELLAAVLPRQSFVPQLLPYRPA